MQGGPRRVSPAMVVACLALFIAIGGAAFAASKIDTGELATGAVTAKKIAAGAIKAKKIADGAVRTSKLGADAVTGDKLNESTLGKVPSALNADTATNAANADKVGGLTVKKFSVARATPSGLSNVITVGTLTLQAGCEADNSPLFTVIPAPGAAPQAVRSSVVFQGDNTTRGAGQGTLPPEGLAILNGSEPNQTSDGTVEATTAAGDVTTIQWASRGPIGFPTVNPDPNQFSCIFFGTAIAG